MMKAINMNKLDIFNIYFVKIENSRKNTRYINIPLMY